MDEEKEHDVQYMPETKETHEHSEKPSMIGKIGKNPWIISTLIFGILVIVLLAGNFIGITGNVTKEKAADSLVAYLNKVADSEVTLVNVKDDGNFYLATLGFKGDELPVYITKDGSKYTMNLMEIQSDVSAGSTITQEIPKTDKPAVELYVFTYCPYGTQMEKAMIPAVKLLGDKIDFKIRQIGAMHGDFEKIEAERQLCIEKNYPDKFLDYVLAFAEDEEIGACNGDDACVKPLINAIYTEFGIDEAKINSCMTSEGETLYNAEEANSKKTGHLSSPTLIVNEVEAQASRSPDAIKTLICNAFNTAPSECSQILSTSQASAGFGSGTSTGAAANCG